MDSPLCISDEVSFTLSKFEISPSAGLRMIALLQGPLHIILKINAFAQNPDELRIDLAWA